MTNPLAQTAIIADCVYRASEYDMVMHTSVPPLEVSPMAVVLTIVRDEGSKLYPVGAAIYRTVHCPDAEHFLPEGEAVIRSVKRLSRLVDLWDVRIVISAIDHDEGPLDLSACQFVFDRQFLLNALQGSA